MVASGVDLSVSVERASRCSLLAFSLATGLPADVADPRSGVGAVLVPRDGQEPRARLPVDEAAALPTLGAPTLAADRGGAFV